MLIVGRNIKTLVLIHYVLLLFVATTARATQEEVFAEDLTSSPVILSSNTAVSSQSTLVPGTLVLSQAAVGKSAGVDAEETDTGVDEDDELLVDQYTLPRSAAPVATDANLQSSSPVGQNTQAALTRPRGVKTDSNTGFFPSISLGISTEYNPQRAPGEAATNTTDTVVRVIPVLAYRGAINNRHPYELSAAAGIDSFEKFTYLDSDTLALSGAVNLDISEIVQGDLYISHTDGEDPRGASTTRDLTLVEPNDEYERDVVGGRVTIGRRSNILQLVLGVDQNEIQFTNNNQSLRDREDNSINAGLYLNVGPRTAIFLNGRLTDIDYVQASQSGFDSEEASLTIGVGWEPSRYTSLIFDVGNLQKDFADPTKLDYDDLTYSGRLQWAPTNNTNLGLYASLRTEESTEFLSPYTESDLLGINLQHSFTDRFRGQAFYNKIEDDLVNVRQDEIDDFGVGVFFDLARWITLGANWHQSTRHSTDPSVEYESESLGFTLNISGTKEAQFGNSQTSEELGQGSLE